MVIIVCRKKNSCQWAMLAHLQYTFVNTKFSIELLHSSGISVSSPNLFFFFFAMKLFCCAALISHLDCLKRVRHCDFTHFLLFGLGVWTSLHTVCWVWLNILMNYISVVCGSSITDKLTHRIDHPKLGVKISSLEENCKTFRGSRVYISLIPGMSAEPMLIFFVQMLREMHKANKLKKTEQPSLSF